MCNELISRKTVIDNLSEAMNKMGLSAEMADYMIQVIQQIPAVEAAPIVHARWINRTCSGCQNVYFGYDNPRNNFKRCIECGAIMDQEG